MSSHKILHLKFSYFRRHPHFEFYSAGKNLLYLSLAMRLNSKSFNVGSFYCSCFNEEISKIDS